MANKPYTRVNPLLSVLPHHTSRLLQPLLWMWALRGSRHLHSASRRVQREEDEHLGDAHCLRGFHGRAQGGVNQATYHLKHSAHVL